MTWDASARVNDLFAASARDCTPAPARHLASVLFAPVSRNPEVVSRCASVLSDAEKRRAQRFLAEGGEAHFTQQRAFRRYCGALAVGSGSPHRASLSKHLRKGVPFSPSCRGAGSAFPPAGLDTLGHGLQHILSASTSKMRHDASSRPSSRNRIFHEPRRRPLKAPASGPACEPFSSFGRSRNLP